MTMKVLDTVLRSGPAVLQDGSIVETGIGIAGGCIAALAAPGTLSAETAVDVKGLLVMPGPSTHIHLGHGFDISRCALRAMPRLVGRRRAGGVTTFVSYVMGSKPFEPALFDEVCAVTACGPRRFWTAPRHLDRRAACSGAYLRHGVRRAVLQTLHVPLRQGRGSGCPTSTMALAERPG
jgi:hypothetical protein